MADATANRHVARQVATSEPRPGVEPASSPTGHLHESRLVGSRRPRFSRTPRRRTIFSRASPSRVFERTSAKSSVAASSSRAVSLARRPQVLADAQDVPEDASRGDPPRARSAHDEACPRRTAWSRRRMLSLPLSCGRDARTHCAVRRVFSVGDVHDADVPKLLPVRLRLRLLRHLVVVLRERGHERPTDSVSRGAWHEGLHGDVLELEVQTALAEDDLRATSVPLRSSRGSGSVPELLRGLDDVGERRPSPKVLKM